MNFISYAVIIEKMPPTIRVIVHQTINSRDLCCSQTGSFDCCKNVVFTSRIKSFKVALGQDEVVVERRAIVAQLYVLSLARRRVAVDVHLVHLRLQRHFFFDYFSEINSQKS